MGHGIGRPAAAALTGVLLLAGCGGPDPGAGAGAGAEQLPTASAAPTPRSSVPVASAPAPSAPTGTPAAPTTPVPANPEPRATAAAPAEPSVVDEAPVEQPAVLGFAECATAYLGRSQGAELGGPVTPLLLEEWAEAFAAASALEADGDAAGAADACRRLLDRMAAVLG